MGVDGVRADQPNLALVHQTGHVQHPSAPPPVGDRNYLAGRTPSWHEYQNHTTRYRANCSKNRDLPSGGGAAGDLPDTAEDGGAAGGSGTCAGGGWREPCKVYPVARAVRQMEAAGKAIRAEQRVRVLCSRGKLGVRAWDALEKPNSRSMDIKCYQILLKRAVERVLAPIGHCVTGGKDKEFRHLIPDKNAEPLGEGGTQRLDYVSISKVINLVNGSGACCLRYVEMSFLSQV